MSDKELDRRVDSLNAAWRVLTRGDDLRPVEVTDLIAVAHWLHTGQDPWPTSTHVLNSDEASWSPRNRDDAEGLR